MALSVTAGCSIKFVTTTLSPLSHFDLQHLHILLFLLGSMRIFAQPPAPETPKLSQPSTNTRYSSTILKTAPDVKDSCPDVRTNPSKFQFFIFSPPAAVPWRPLQGALPPAAIPGGVHPFCCNTDKRTISQHKLSTAFVQRPHYLHHSFLPLPTKTISLLFCLSITFFFHQLVQIIPSRTPSIPLTTTTSHSLLSHYLT